MPNKISSYFFTFALAFQMLFSATSFAADIDLQDLALPSETNNLPKMSGSVFYSTTNKNKTLMPVHFWGEVGRSGLHYIPVDTKLVKGISFAGGGGSLAKLNEVSVNRLHKGKVARHEFDLSAGGDFESHDFTLHAGDTVFIKKDRFYENRAYYTSLAALCISVLSSIIIYNAVN